MSIWAELRAMTPVQRKVVTASFLGWTLDAFDFFVLIVVMKSIAADFHAAVPDVALAVTLTLAMRPFGAFVFGMLADKYGRRPILMLDILLFSVFELASAFAPTLTALLILRALFGFAMGGEWGLGASLTMETIPEKTRGIVSGLLQQGYAFGNLLAAFLFWALFDHIGWRGMFIVGFVPALLVVYIRAHVPESPVWEHTRRQPAAHRSIAVSMRGLWGRALFMVVLMTLFNFFSHGTQDLYTTFLQVERGFGTDIAGKLSIVGPVGAICGGMVFGALSEHIGRRRAIVIAALLALPTISLWALGSTPLLLGIGVFAIQFMVQGAWGVVPVHLNELSPDAVRATMPGLTYQIGNFISSGAPWLLSTLAEANGKQYGLTMAIFIAGVAIALAITTALGPEAKGQRFGAAAIENRESQVAEGV